MFGFVVSIMVMAMMKFDQWDERLSKIQDAK